MIDKTLSFVLGELNGFLGTNFPSNEPHAVLSGLANQDGSAPLGVENKIILSLTNVERETAVSPGPVTRPDPGAALRVSPPLSLNIFILVSSNFGSYVESLRFLSSSIGFLQAKPVFTPQNSAGFPRGLERLSIEMVNLNMSDLQNLWATMGGKYLPSVFYKLRMITIQDGWITERIPVIAGSETKV
jgi:hypothetical protein